MAKRTITVEVMSQFLRLCEVMKIDPQAVMAEYINNLTVQAVLVSKRGPDLDTLAAFVFQETVQRPNPLPADFKYSIHLERITELANLDLTVTNPAIRKRKYQKIIDKWHTEIQEKRQ